MIAWANAARAQWDDFNDNNDAGWTRYAPLTGVGAPTTFIMGNGAYGILPTASPNPSLYGPALGGSFRNDVTYSDFSISFDVVHWDGALNQSFGTMARANQIGYQTTDGYALLYDTVGFLELARVTDEVRTVLAAVPLSLTAPPFIGPTNIYHFNFGGSGDSLSGEVFSVQNGVRQSLVQISAVDGTWSSGVNGFMVFATDQSHAYATFDNYSASVPEPSVWNLIIAVPLILVGARRRKLKMKERKNED